MRIKVVIEKIEKEIIHAKEKFNQNVNDVYEKFVNEMKENILEHVDNLKTTFNNTSDIMLSRVRARNR